MDELLAKERASNEYVRSLQSNPSTPFKDVLDAFKQYRATVQTLVFEKLADAERLESRLWQQHTETRQTLARTLKDLRKMPEQRIVETRVAVEMYLRFIKQSISFYRGYIHHLSTRFGGIPELQAVAHQVKPNSAADADTGMSVDAELRQQVLNSCYRTLIYLGDLCRYRATDHLDAQQDFGPAIGFYSLACTIRSDSGWSYHQQGVVALEQKDYLRAIYYLYRSFLAPEPLHMAKRNLAAQFEKANVAWERGELIARGPPHDPAAGEKALVGYLVRLHSMCVKGEPVRGYEELLHELLTRLKSLLHQRPLESKLQRMTFVNISAQHNAMENYKVLALQSSQNEQAFYYSMHINIVFFTTLLETLQTELVVAAKNPKLVGEELSLKVSVTMAQVLPALVLYSNWLVINVHLVLGLSSNAFLTASIERLWKVYAEDLDMISFVFPIWDLEDCEQVNYLLEESVEKLGFTPLLDPQNVGDLVHKSLHDSLGHLKLRFSDATVTRLGPSDEALHRVLRLLEAGSYLVTNVDGTPLFIRGTRFSFGEDTELRALPRPPTPPPVEKPKPLSYAAAASKKQAITKALSAAIIRPGATTPAPSHDDQSVQRADQLHRMVDNLVDDDDPDQPVTPPQQQSNHNTVISGTNDVLITGLSPPDYGSAMSPSATAIVPATALVHEHKRSYGSRSKEDLSAFSPRPKLAADRVASLWSPSEGNSQSQSRRGSPALHVRSPHQRQSSSASNRSAASPQLADSWHSGDGVPGFKHIAKGSFSNGIAATGLLQQGLASSPVDRVLSSPQQVAGNQNASPLLFGRGSIWSANPSASPRAEFGG
ncbi:hypothetical protein AMS68_001673 [Peltaster fructicola]|uniref:DNA/RNA-binding domain-containing protein n=1 Tax=Peltaster fructicola TaxID=286661 RepID=A0A6H0XN77_9PEZI|nr:hypothetical protein AMS68_001673 [Peltaster fructicola]